MLIKSGSAFVIDSGTVNNFNGNPIEFVFDETDKNSLTLVLEFRNDNETEQGSIEIEDVDQKTRKMILFNFNSLLGAGTRKPMALGYINDMKLYAHFKITAPDEDCDKVINYTFYLNEEEESDND